MGRARFRAPSSLLPIRIVRTRAETEALCEELLAHDGVVALDTEWIGFNKERHVVNNGLVFCMTLCWRREDGELERVYVHNYGASEGNIHALTPWLKSEAHVKAGHNVPVDWHIVANHGIHIRSFKIDTMVLDHALDENRENAHDLKSCAKDFLGREREDFRHTFGSLVLKKDGTPYANKKLDVPTLSEYVSGLPEPPTYDEAVDGTALERLEWTTAWGDTPVPQFLGPFHRWLVLFDYAVADAWDTFELYELFRPKMEATPWLGDRNYWEYYYSTETRITEIICGMERKGMNLDVEMLQEMELVASDELEFLETKIVEWANCPIKITSDKQLGMLLHGSGRQPVFYKTSKKKVDYYIDGMELPVMRWTPGGQAGTGAEDLKKLLKHLKKINYQNNLDGLDALIRHAKAGWHRGNLQAIREKSLEGRIRCRINQIGTTSGRFSTSNPVNLQNVTTGDKDLYHLRDCFCAPPGCVLIIADFSQLEYRLLAHFSQEPKLIQLFFEGWDLHSLTGYNIYDHIKGEVDAKFGRFTKEAGDWIAEHFPDDRKRSKTLNFEIIYGVGPGKLGEQLGISKDEAWRMIDGWFKGYPFVKAWQKRELALARGRGFGRTLAGRYRHANLDKLNHDCKPGCRHRDPERPERRCGIKGEEERTFINALIQGSAADMCKKAMILISDNQRLAELKLDLTMQVHDELAMECPIAAHKEAVQIIRPLMEKPFNKPLRIPMPVSIGVGPTWASAKV